MDIICTMGPAVSSINTIDSFIEEGMTMMRFNFSHPIYDDFSEYIKYIKKNYPSVGVFQDLQGSKIRVSDLFSKEIKIYPKEVVYFCTETFYKNNSHLDEILIPLNISQFKYKEKCFSVSMKDGTMEFKVLNYAKDYIRCSVLISGIIRSKKSVNITSIDRGEITLSEKDKRDIIWGMENGVDIVCLSYTTKGDNILEVKSLCKTIKKHKPELKIPKVWAKIEDSSGVENFKDILKASDGILLGRGDLSSEVTYEELPIIQNNLIKIKRRGKPLIVATYVLESLKKNNKPTIPEMDDIFNLINFGVSGFMLAGESSLSQSAVTNVKYLKKLTDLYNKKET